MTGRPFRQSPEDRQRAARAHAISRFATGEFDDWPAERDAAASFIAQRESDKTAATYASALVAYFRWCRTIPLRPFEVRRAHAKRYLAETAALAPCTRANRCVVVRSFYNDVLDDDEAPIDRNPFQRVGPRRPAPVKKTPALTQAQFEALLVELRAAVEADPRRLIAHRDFALIYTMGRIGPRAMTTSHLRWGSFSRRGDLGLAELHLKGNRYDEVETPADVLAVLAAWHRRLGTALGRQLTASDAVFPAIGAHARRIVVPGCLDPLTEDGISYIVRKRLKLIDVVGRGWAAHAMRATAATVAHEQGASIEEIQSMLCHLNRQQTEGYVRRRTVRSAARHWQPSMAEPLDLLGDGLQLGV